jgi:peptide/nickel transport system substrate-binding protein
MSSRKNLKLKFPTLALAALAWLLPSACRSQGETGILPRKDALTVVVTDSGLGGLAVIAQAAARLKESRAYRAVNLVFANALFSNDSGYNSLPNRAEKIRVFDSALRGIAKTSGPDLILVGCNTLSVLTEDVPFVRETEVPVLGIVEAGVEMIARSLSGDPSASVILFGTETTIAEDTHRQKLLARGIAADRVIPQACPELAAYIENDWRGEDTALLVEAYVDEALEKLPNPKSPVIAALVCTHYGYALDSWTKAFAGREANLKAVLNPNEAMIDAVFPPGVKSRFAETKVAALVLSMVEIADNKRASLGEWLGRVSPEFSAALGNYELKPDLFSWKESDVITVVQSSVDIGDPHICSDSVNRLSLVFSVYEALVRRDAAGAYRPALAERWSVSEDARTWTFELRPNVRFHDGTTLRADDVTATLGRVLDPAIGGAFGTQGVYLSYLGNARISKVDDLKVRIVTGEPMADLLDLLVAMPISPAGALARLPDEYVGSGPYRIREKNAETVVLEAFSSYWGGAPKFAEIRWVAEADPDKRADALLGGRADIIAGVADEGRTRILGSARHALHRQGSGLCIIFMLNALEGPCRDSRVRRALNYALDVEAIIAEVKPGAAVRLNGYLTARHFGYDPAIPAYPYEPETARRLLAEAGYPNGLKLGFDIPSSMPDEAPRLAKVMADQLRKAGIVLEIVEHADRAGYSEMVRAKKIRDGCCFDSSPRSAFRVLREKLQSTLRGPWWEGYENAMVNDLIGRAQATVSAEEREAIYRRIFALVRDDAPWIFLYEPVSFWAVGPSLKDWKPRADGLLIF